MDCSTIFPTFRLHPLTSVYSMAQSCLIVETCLEGGENRIYKVEPYLICLCQISSVGVADGFGPLPLSKTVYQLLDDFLELRALLERVVLCAFTNWSQHRELGDGPFPKRDPPPPDITRQVLLLTKIGVEFFDKSPYS